MVTRNGIETLPEVLDAIARQRTTFSVEMIAVDSSSTDGTRELLAGRVTDLMSIPASAFNHGITRNLGISRSRGDYVVLLVQDAIPASDDWLQTLVTPLIEHPHLAGTFARQIARSDASGIARHSLAGGVASGTIGWTSQLASRAEFDALTPVDRLRRATFDNVCACIRRTVWLKHPFRQTPIAEDLEWARDVLLDGHRLAFVPDAAVVHTHDRSLVYEFHRTYDLHGRLFELFGLQTIPTWPLLTRAIVSSAVAYTSCEWRQPLNLPRALGLAVVWPLAQYLGGRAAARRHPNGAPRFHPCES